MDELYHYGVPGMKWGHRKAVQLTSAYAKTGVGKAHMNATKKIVGTTLGAQRKINKAVKNANTPEAQAARKAKMKKAAIAGAAVAGTALAAYGGYKLNKYVRDTNYEYHRKKGEQLARSYMESWKVRETNSKLRSDYNTAAKRFEGAVRLNQKSIGTRQKEMTRAAQRIDKFNEGVARVAANKRLNEVRKADTDSFVTAAKNVYQYNKRKRR